MIADLKPYPVMKDSGVEWLGEVPAHWADHDDKADTMLSSLARCCRIHQIDR